MTGLVLVSLVTAVAVLLAFKWTADQPALVAAKRAMQAAIFEMRLFNDDLAALFRAQAEVLRHTLSYLRLSLAPTLWLMVPMLALLLHMEFRFGYTGLTIGEAALVKVRFAGARTAGLAGSARRRRVETPGVLLPSEREIAWRIRPRATGIVRTARPPGRHGAQQDAGGVRRGGATIASPARQRSGESAALPFRVTAAERVRVSPRSRLPIHGAPSRSLAGTSAGRVSTWR